MDFKTKHLARLWVGISLLFSSLTIVSAQTAVGVDDYGRWINGVTEPWMFSESLSKQTIAKAQSKWSSFESSKTAADPWVGDFFIGGDTHGSYLRLSRNGFVLFHVNKCAALVTGLSYGTAIVSPGLIQMLPETIAHDVNGHHHESASTRFLPVKWNSDLYLVPESEIADFGDYVAGLGKYNDPNSLFVEFSVFFFQIRCKA